MTKNYQKLPKKFGDHEGHSHMRVSITRARIQLAKVQPGRAEDGRPDAERRVQRHRPPEQLATGLDQRQDQHGPGDLRRGPKHKC